ncbi:MAG: hypothetical protein ABEK17_00940 [Candidatus Aenigmatarchaeota archaeon]
MKEVDEIDILISTVHEHTSVNDLGEIFIAEPDREDLREELKALMED